MLLFLLNLHKTIMEMYTVSMLWIVLGLVIPQEQNLHAVQGNNQENVPDIQTVVLLGVNIKAGCK